MQIVFDFFYQISGVTHLVFPPIMVEDHLNENMVLVLSSQPNTNRKQQIVINAKSKIKTLMFKKNMTMMMMIKSLCWVTENRNYTKKKSHFRPRDEHVQNCETMIMMLAMDGQIDTFEWRYRRCLSNEQLYLL